MSTYNDALKAARDELSQWLKQRQVCDAKIKKLTAVIEHLSALCEDLPPSPSLPTIPGDMKGLGMTDAIRRVLANASGRSLTPVEIRDWLRESGFNLSKYENEMPPIHNTLKRLKETGELLELERSNGKTYMWGQFTVPEPPTAQEYEAAK